MKIAIPYENGQVFQHFGHSAQFKLYTAEEGRITGAEVVSTDGQGHGALVGFLVRNGVNVLLCGGIGGGAQMALAQAGIRLCGGITGEADSAAAAYLAGTLVFDPNARCTHHDHEESHSCGSHACHADKGVTGISPVFFNLFISLKALQAIGMAMVKLHASAQA